MFDTIFCKPSYKRVGANSTVVAIVFWLCYSSAGKSIETVVILTSELWGIGSFGIASSVPVEAFCASCDIGSTYLLLSRVCCQFSRSFCCFVSLKQLFVFYSSCCSVWMHPCSVAFCCEWSLWTLFPCSVLFCLVYAASFDLTVLLFVWRRVLGHVSYKKSDMSSYVLSFLLVWKVEFHIFILLFVVIFHHANLFSVVWKAALQILILPCITCFNIM